MKIYTIGFTRKTAQQFFDLLRSADASYLVDTRLNNTSQLARFTVAVDLRWFIDNLDGFEDWNYVEVASLAPTAQMLKTYRDASRSKRDRDAAWELYAEQYLELMEKRRAIELIDERMFSRGIVLLCSEHEPDRCHRRLVVEEIKKTLYPGCEIIHL